MSKYFKESIKWVLSVLGISKDCLIIALGLTLAFVALPLVLVSDVLFKFLGRWGKDEWISLQDFIAH